MVLIYCESKNKIRILAQNFWKVPISIPDFWSKYYIMMVLLAIRNLSFLDFVSSFYLEDKGKAKASLRIRA